MLLTRAELRSDKWGLRFIQIYVDYEVIVGSPRSVLIELVTAACQIINF